MSQELHYTSVPRGLKPGARGFCTVAHTAGLSQALFERLEGLSGYRPRFKPNDPNAALNPVVWSHLRLTGTGPGVTVISRVGSAGLDYTGRENKHAHHLVLDPGERPSGGPAWLLSRPGFMQATWTEAPRVLPNGPSVPAGDRPPAICRAWESQAGDAGWAGVVAESFLADSKRPIVVIYDPGADILALFAEAVALLPPEHRWEATFSTYFTGLAPGISCGWRGVLRDSPEERQARSNPDSLIIDLGRPARVSQVSALVNQARTGVRPATVRPAPRPRSSAEVPVPSRTSVTPSPVADFSINVDDSSIAPPPPGPRPRRPSQTVSPRTSGSAWPIVGASAAAFALGLALGGTGVALYFRNDSPRPEIELAKADTPKVEHTATTKPDPGPTKIKTEGVVQTETPSTRHNANLIPPETGAEAATIGADDPASSAAEPSKKPVEKTLTPSPSGTSPAKSGQNPTGSADPGDKGETTRPSQPGVDPIKKPSDNVPPTIGFFKIPLLFDPLIDSPSSIKVGGPVKNLSLIGGEDPALKPYFFNVAKDDKEQGHFNINEGKDTTRRIGTFEIKGSAVFFAWDVTTALMENELKKSLFDCVLAIDLENNTRSHYLLRDPMMKPLPRPLKDWRKKSPPPKGDSWDFEVAWCGKVPGEHPDLDGTKRLFSLKKVLITQESGEVLTLQPDSTDKKKYYVPLGPPKKLSVELWGKSLGDLRFSLPRKPRTEVEIGVYLSSLARPDNPTLTAEEKKKLEKWREEAEQERLWIKTVDALLGGRVEAVVTFKAGDMEFALPKLESGDSQ